jgi:hypothetical protein
VLVKWNLELKSEVPRTSGNQKSRQFSKVNFKSQPSNGADPHHLPDGPGDQFTYVMCNERDRESFERGAHAVILYLFTVRDQTNLADSLNAQAKCGITRGTFLRIEDWIVPIWF